MSSSVVAPVCETPLIIHNAFNARLKIGGVFMCEGATVRRRVLMPPPETCAQMARRGFAKEKNGSGQFGKG
jgi:hypothetical protein